ncbi:dCMP deaminase family protein [Patescibacteria group bacterium]|nr:dCMP deaminase family protein [Patescibacteria group bacterium]
MKKRRRLSKIEYYLGIAKAVAQRATCLRRVFGVVAVVEDEIVSTGYCGSPRGGKNCTDLGFCEREKQGIPSGEKYEFCRSVHAEENAIISARRKDIKGGVMYLYGKDFTGGGSHFRVEPCIMCKRKIINAGIRMVYTINPAGDILKFHVDDWVEDESYMIYKGGSGDA